MVEFKRKSVGKPWMPYLEIMLGLIADSSNAKCLMVGNKEASVSKFGLHSCENGHHEA